MISAQRPDRALVLQSLDTGECSIGPPPAGPAGIEVVPIPGGSALIDPSAPHVVPTLLITDADAAQEAVEQLVGHTAADALLDLSWAEPQTELIVEVDPEPSPSAQALLRYGLARWLLRWNPLALDATTLLVEAVLARTALDDWLGAAHQNVSWSDVEPSLDELAPVILAAAPRLTQDPPEHLVPDQLLRTEQLLVPLVADAADALLRETNLPHRHELSALSARLRHDLAWPAPEASPRWDRLMRAGRPRAASDLGTWGAPEDLPRDAGRGVGTVDWPMVPVGTTTRSEENVHWWSGTETAQTTDLEVRVAAQPVRPTHGLGGLVIDDQNAAAAVAHLQHPDAQLEFRVYSERIGIPIAQQHLSRSADGRWWSGQVAITTDLLRNSGALTVEVHDSRCRRAPRTGDAAIAAEALRWAGRGLALTRLSFGDNGPGHAAAAEPWERARQLFALVAHRRGPHADLAARQATRCEAMLIAVYDGTDQRAQARQRRRSLAASSAAGFPDDAHVPELRSSAWSMTTAERVLLLDDPQFGG